MKQAKKFEAEVSPFLSGMLMREDSGGFEDEDVVAAYALLHSIEAMIKKRKESLREHVVALVQEDGSPTEKGGMRGRFGGAMVTYEKRVDAMPDEDKLMKRLAALGLNPELVYTEVKTKVLDASKIAQIVEQGKLPQSAVDESRKVSYALKVSPTTEMEVLLETASVPSAPAAGEQVSKPRAKKSASGGARKGG